MSDKDGLPERDAAKRSIADLSQALDDARAEIARLRTRVRSLERQVPPDTGLPRRTRRRVWTRHQVDEALALSKYGCSLSEIADRLRLSEIDLQRILKDPQRARSEARP